MPVIHGRHHTVLHKLSLELTYENDTFILSILRSRDGKQLTRNHTPLRLHNRVRALHMRGNQASSEFLSQLFRFPTQSWESEQGFLSNPVLDHLPLQLSSMLESNYFYFS